MKKEELVSLGLSDEQAEKVVKLHADEINGSFIPKSRFNEVNEENKTLKATISDRDKQLETLSKANGDMESLKAQISELQKANAEAVKAHETQIAQMKLDNAVESMLISSGAKNVKAVRSLFDESGFKLNDKGEVEGLAEAVKSIQESDPYLFDVKVSGNQRLAGFQPERAADSNAPKDPKDMNYDELCAYFSNGGDAAQNN